MSDNTRWTRKQAERVLDHIADSIEAGDPTEITADLKDSGHDLNDITSRMKIAALAGVKQFQQQRLHSARQRYEESSARIERRTRDFGDSREERRKQFFSVLAARPELKSALTVQYRDLDELTDRDIDSALDDLEALGALEGLDDSHS